MAGRYGEFRRTTVYLATLYADDYKVVIPISGIDSVGVSNSI